MRSIIILLALLVPSWALALPTNYQQARFTWDYNDTGWGAQYFQIACGKQSKIYTLIGRTTGASSRTVNISIVVPKTNGTYFCVIRAVNGTVMSPQSTETSFRVDGNWVYEK